MARSAEGRNRSLADYNEFALLIDPVGIHILTIHFVHNDTEMRCLWLVKLRDQTMPVQIWLDVELEMFNSCVFPHEVSFVEASKEIEEDVPYYN